MKQPRKICVVTGSRAEYGVLRWLMREIDTAPVLKLQLLVTGMHLAPEFGHTIDEIIADGFIVDELVESQLSSDTTIGMVKSLGLGMIGCADSFRRMQPDIVVVIGDRYEILAATQAASLMGIPVAHISGGEVTEGAVDDWIRHAISKASWWHFVAAEAYRKRVVQLGEAPERIFNVGDPGLDSVRKLPLMSQDALESDLGISLAPPFFLVTYHPATLGELPPEQAFAELLAALDQFPQASVILTRPNADAGGRRLAEMAESWATQRAAPTRYVISLGQLRYLSLARMADAVIGNSSSGIIEIPALKVATVNIGTRQNGRLRANSILDCGENHGAIVHAIQKALSPEFRAILANTVSLYGDCDASRQIAEILINADLPVQLGKRFHDI
ncbi:UDP-N-acetylglucosamine 2-epimerase (hydrolyzing) [Candidatus Kaiserbacteria bacterium]|nr:UDP-N-acetylglucosamine 2-epimerase (hydrolyzing) [Candidatus Kaiserbacteria bacterium]